MATAGKESRPALREAAARNAMAGAAGDCVRQEDQAEEAVVKGVTSHVLYRHFDASGTLLYVGISLSGLVRLSQHKSVSPWFVDIARVEFERHPTRDAALEAERKAIQTEKPLHNIMHVLSARKESERAAFRVVSEIKTARPSLADTSRDDVVHRLTRFDPLYDDQGLADALRLPVRTIRQLIEDGELSSIQLWNTTKTRKIRRITGWAVIDWLESKHAE